MRKDQIIELIYSEFADVTREGGVSWNEALAYDCGGDPEMLAKAKLIDTENRWEDLVDSVKWDLQEWSCNWSFLDSIGFRYYLAAAMVKDLQSSEGILTDFHFWFTPRETFEDFSDQQKMVVAEYVHFKLEQDRAENFPDKIGSPPSGGEPFSDDIDYLDSSWRPAERYWQPYRSSHDS